MEDECENMEDPVRKSQKAFSSLFRDWWDQWLQDMLGDEVLRQYWSATQAGSQPHQATGIDPYRVLGLQKTAPDEQIKKRYRELLIKLHPDTAEVEGTEFMFQLLLAAYQQIGRERGWRK